MQPNRAETPKADDAPGPIPLPRRHDVDWLRAMAIGFLIVFHVLLSFQSWAASSGFPQNGELLDELVSCHA